MSTTTTALAALTGDYVLDTGRTRIGFVARHALSTRVRGHFDDFEGRAHLDGAVPARSHVRLTLRADSIRTGNARRDEHLCAAFLGTAGFPAVEFASTEVRRTGDTRFAVTGDLTLRSVTRPVTLDLELTGGGDGHRVALRGGAVIDRFAWGVNQNAATRFMVSPKVRLELEVAVLRLG
ncbi:YceI family protein [Streptomyces sp. NPDC004327]|uniref:YceI family protein n=1 Tax=Streptomyces sp. NPDC004327 TaxID=3364699 RepID=UPI0036AF767E